MEFTFSKIWKKLENKSFPRESLLRRIVPRAVCNHLPLKVLKNQTICLQTMLRGQFVCDAESTLQACWVEPASCPYSWSFGPLRTPPFHLRPRAADSSKIKNQMKIIVFKSIDVFSVGQGGRPACTASFFPEGSESQLFLTNLLCNRFCIAIVLHWFFVFLEALICAFSNSFLFARKLNAKRTLRAN